MVLRLLLAIMLALWGVTGCADNGTGTNQQDDKLDGQDQGQDQDQDQNTDWFCDPDDLDCFFDAGTPDGSTDDGGIPDSGPNNTDQDPDDNDGGPNNVDGGDGWFDISDRDPTI